VGFDAFAGQISASHIHQRDVDMHEVVTFEEELRLRQLSASRQAIDGWSSKRFGV
jgi:hypothetical protein